MAPNRSLSVQDPIVDNASCSRENRNRIAREVPERSSTIINGSGRQTCVPTVKKGLPNERSTQQWQIFLAA